MTTTRYTRRFIIVQPAAGRAAANTQALSVDTVGGAQTFRVPLSPTGTAPATHYWCDWALQPSEHTALALALGTLAGALAPQLFNAASFTPEQVLQTLGLKRVSALTLT